jgi:hypothetical protein
MSAPLNLATIALRLALRAGPSTAAVSRLRRLLTLLPVALALAATAMGFGLHAAFVYLATLLPAAAAAAIIAGTLLALAALLVAIALRRPRKAAAATASGSALEPLLAAFSAWARSNPWEAAIAAVAIGYVLGSRR